MPKQKYSVILKVERIKGYCPLYKVGDEIVLHDFYIDSSKSNNICIHLLAASSTLLSAFIHGSSAIDLGIGKTDDVGYLQCPDPGPPYTKGGTVLFKLIRKKLDNE